MHQGYKTIGLCGVDIALDGVTGETEYAHQRPSVEYYIGLAEGRGIEIVIPEVSELLRCGYLYGWDNPSVGRQKYVERARQLAQNEAEAVDAYNQQKWQLAECKGFLRALAETKNEDKEILERVRQQELEMTNNFQHIERIMHQTRGALNDANWFLRNYLPGDGPHRTCSGRLVPSCGSRRGKSASRLWVTIPCPSRATAGRAIGSRP